MQTASERGRELSFQLDNDALDPQTAYECLQSSNLTDQSLAFEVFTGASIRTVMKDLSHDLDIPMMLLDHLLNCISADLPDTETEDLWNTVSSRGEAFLDLRVPLADDWSKYDCLLEEERYFARIVGFLKADPDQYYSEIVTHTLEAWSPKAKPFKTIMKEWKADPVRSKYVADLEGIFACSF